MDVVDIYPVGAVIALGAEHNPVPGWLPCDGRMVPEAEYKDLLKALGYTYGRDGDRFGLPDYRGRFQRGAVSVAAVGTIENWSTRRPNTAFSGRAYYLPDSQVECTLGFDKSARKGDAQALSLTGGGDKETRPVNVYVEYYIKVR
jgi:hypothetical protein